jgi:hypothetical protein
MVTAVSTGRRLPVVAVFASVLGAAISAAGAPTQDVGVELVASPAAAVAQGQRGAVSLTLLPRAGHRLLDDAPVIVSVSGDGVTPARAIYHRDDAVDPRAEAPRFELAFRATRSGRAELRARCTFYVCRGERCRPVESEAVFAITVD